MHVETYPQKLMEKDLAISFNMGLKAAICVLEKSEELSAEGRIFLLEELRKQIAESEE